MAKEVVIGAAALERRLAAIANAKTPESYLRNLAVLLVQNAKAGVPRKTGNLARSIRVASVTPVSAQVVASANYAGYVEFGTRPHEITPQAARALRWAAKGGARLTGSPRKGADVVFAKRVHHPGTRANPFMQKAVRKTVSQGGAKLAEPIVQAWNDAA